MGRVEKQERGSGDLGERGSPALEAGRDRQTETRGALCRQVEAQQCQAPQLTLTSPGVTWLSLGTLPPPLTPALSLLL